MLWEDALGDEPSLFAELDCLSAALGAELVEETAGMSLDGILADEQLFRDFAVAQAGSDQSQDFVLPRSDSQLGESLIVSREWRAERRGVRLRLSLRDGEPEPYPQSSKDGRYESAVDFEGVLEDQETVLAELQDRNQDAAAQPVKQDIPERPVS